MLHIYSDNIDNPIACVMERLNDSRILDQAKRSISYNEGDKTRSSFKREMHMCTDVMKNRSTWAFAWT